MCRVMIANLQFPVEPVTQRKSHRELIWTKKTVIGKPQHLWNPPVPLAPISTYTFTCKETPQAPPPLGRFPGMAPEGRVHWGGACLPGHLCLSPLGIEVLSPLSLPQLFPGYWILLGMET